MEHIENRSFLIIILKPPFIEWINSVEDDDIELLDRKSIYLVKDLMSISGNIRKMIQKHYLKIFQNELSNWYTDKKTWPSRKKMTFELFNKWFDWDYIDGGMDILKGDIVKSPSNF